MKVGHANNKNIDEKKRGSWTPWILSLKFDNEKLITAHVWNTIIRKLKDKYKNEFDLIEEVELNLDRQPEILLRLTATMLSVIGDRNVYRFMKQK